MIVTIILGILICIGLVFLIEKFVPLKLTPVISILLWVIIAFLGYQLYESINAPVRFNKVKEKRYRQVIKNLKDIRAAELAYLEINGKFTGSYDSLVKFVDTAQFAITQRRDTVYDDVAKNKAYGIKKGYFIEKVLIDTLGYVPVKDSLFKGTTRYKTMMKVPIKGVDATIDLKAGKLDKNGTIYPVFEAKVDKAVVLYDQPKDLVIQEKQLVSVDGVNGPYIKVGSLTDVDTSGNWPKLYETELKK
jgi:hypothetical protein